MIKTCIPELSNNKISNRHFCQIEGGMKIFVGIVFKVSFQSLFFYITFKQEKSDSLMEKNLFICITDNCFTSMSVFLIVFLCEVLVLFC